MSGRSTLRVGRLAGIPIGIHPLWLLIVGLLTWSLGGTYFPDRDAGLDDGPAYALGLLSALLLFGGVLLHELGHALVARRRGVEIEEIDLWMLGGVARMKGEPRRAGDELAFALAGPAVTAVLVLLAGAARLAIGSGGARWLVALADYQLIVNAMILSFNLLPAFPLDGGRVLRALLWRRSGDQQDATARASAVGHAFGLGMVVLGGLSAMSGAIGGLWLAIIGAFVMVASRAEADALRRRETFAARTVADLMTPSPVVVPGDLTLQEAVVAHVTRALHGAYPVVDADGRVAGILTLAAIRAVPAADRPRRDVTAVMATNPTLLVTPATAVDDVLARPAFLRTGRVVAVDGDGRPVGILSVTDIAREELLSSLLGVDLPAAPRAA